MKKITYNELLNINAKKIVLIGMPGSGKSFVGKDISSHSNLSFFDTDDLIEKKINMSCGEYICAFGEKAFRQEEISACKTLVHKTNCVIATGGGLVTQDEAMKLICHDAIVIWVQKPIASLDLKGRPLSPTIESALKLYTIRKPLYEKYADYTIYL